jgi:hypothetical protein
MDIFTPCSYPSPPLTCGDHFSGLLQPTDTWRCYSRRFPAVPVVELAGAVAELWCARPAVPCDVEPALAGGWRRGDLRQGHPSRRSRHGAGGAPPGCCGMGPAATFLVGAIGPAEPLPAGRMGRQHPSWLLWHRTDDDTPGGCHRCQCFRPTTY